MNVIHVGPSALMCFLVHWPRPYGRGYYISALRSWRPLRGTDLIGRVNWLPVAMLST